jgi:hypothetical protein
VVEYVKVNELLYSLSLQVDLCFNLRSGLSGQMNMLDNRIFTTQPDKQKHSSQQYNYKGEKVDIILEQLR